MRRIAIIGIFCFVLARPVSPGVLPYPYASEFTQILMRVQQALQLGYQASSLSAQLKQMALMVTQGKLTAAWQWAQNAGTLLTLARNIRQGLGLSYAMANLDGAFRMAYPGYGKSSQDFPSQYRNWQQTTLDTLATVLRGVNLQTGDLNSDIGMQTVIRNFSTSAVGETQAIQAGSMIADAQLSQLEKLRQLMIMQITAESAARGREVNQDSVREQVQERNFNARKFVAVN